jgi:putative membrane protein
LRAEIGDKTERAAKKVDSETQNFVKNARIGGIFEVESSKLALEKTQNAAIRSFAERMIADHGAASQKLEDVVARQGLSVSGPSTPDLLDEKHSNMLESLRQAEAADFDRLYVQSQQDAHEDAAAQFGAYANGGSNTALRAFAQQTLPTLQEHKKHITGMTVS